MYINLLTEITQFSFVRQYRCIHYYLVKTKVMGKMTSQELQVFHNS